MNIIIAVLCSELCKPVGTELNVKSPSNEMILSAASELPGLWVTGETGRSCGEVC